MQTEQSISAVALTGNVMYYGKWVLFGVAAFFAIIVAWYLFEVVVTAGGAFFAVTGEVLGGFTSFLTWLGENPWLAWVAIGLAAFVPLAGYSYKAFDWIKGKVSEYRKAGVPNQGKTFQKWTLNRTKYEAKMYKYDEKIFKSTPNSEQRNKLVAEQKNYEKKFDTKWKGSGLSKPQRTQIKGLVGKGPKRK